MQQIAAALRDGTNFRFKMAKIGAQQGRCNLDHVADCIGSDALVVKRLSIIALLLLGLLVGVFALLFALGRAPSEYAITTDAASHQQTRREAYIHLSYELGKVAAARGDPTSLRARRDAALLKPIETRLGGWDVVYLPPGSRHPTAGAWSKGNDLDPSNPEDPIPLRGKWFVRLRAASWSARAAAALGLTAASQ